MIRADQLLIPLPSTSGVLAHQPGAQNRGGNILAVVTWHLGHDDSANGAPARPLLAKGEPACSA
jgi:hypothetical protein